jgi:hypothetical protein
MVSSGLVGVCLTVLGISRVIVRLRAIRSISQDLLAVDALLFLLACLGSYLALRTRGRIQAWLARISDWIFLGGLSLMAIVCLMIAYATV